ncbi:hypothetical protein [Streptomyces sp. NEAU-S7GS2]|uniref:hypothetical protein n=1 Tax=Streptomyces sp. NEAU-S7GS2 TaxID=2202000 RepID=UPI001EF4E027|nr:hypothetical protein [Streptomyces sp. NEAU-S7GS2]
MDGIHPSHWGRDPNGDGYGDLLARHTDGTLYRYDDMADGQFKSRGVVLAG